MEDVTNSDPAERLLTIGEFARQTHLSTKALRIYDDVGLLPPAVVDSASGYRRYRLEQVHAARLVGLLRGADIGLAEIGLLLRELDIDVEKASERLGQHLRHLETRHSGQRVLIRHIHSVIRHKEPTVFEVETRHVPAQRVMSMQRRLHGHETDAFVAEAKAAFSAHLDGQPPTGPFTLIFHGMVDSESDGPLEAILGCPDGTVPTDAIGIRTEPAHDEAFTPITKAQWDFPAILAAYDAVGCSPQAQARSGSRLSCREVYRAEPDRIGADDLVCDVAFPLS